MPELFAEAPFLEEAPDLALLAGARAGAALSLLSLLELDFRVSLQRTLLPFLQHRTGWERGYLTCCWTSENVSRPASFPAFELRWKQ